jgi:general secretion pathway protein D
MKLKNQLKFISCVFAFALLASCAGLYSNYSTDKIDPLDRPANLDRKDFVENLLPHRDEKPEDSEASKLATPKLSDVLLTPKRPKIGVNKTVTLSITEEVQLKDVFVELARLADIDIEVDSQIRGGIIFKAKNKPFDEVVQRICDLAGLRYSVNNGVLRIQRDTPYVESYQVDFPNITRSNSGTVSVNTGSSGGSGGGGGSSGGAGGASGGGSSGGGGGGITSGSSNSITSSYDGDLWASIEADIKAIMGSKDANAPAGAGGGDSGFVSVNRQASTITVSTTQKNHAMIKEYLERIQQYTSAQVLIEAKVVEVSLNDKFQTGIDWKAVTDFGNGININTAIPTSDGNLTDVVTIKGATDNNNLTSAIQLAQAFGTLRTLSSPRILVLNNQQAVLSFAKNQVYFTLDVQTDTTGGTNGGSSNTQTTVNSTLNTIPVGLILTLQPAINEKTGEVLMNIRPTVSRLTGNKVEDPAVAFAVANSTNKIDIKSEIPEVEVREMDSLLRLSSGEVMAIGGMIEQRVNNNDTGVPYISEVPILGDAFKTTLKDQQSIQTVIFLKATIVPSHGVDKQDRKFYNTFESDPRPFEFK